MDTASLSVEDIKIKKEQERANCYGFDVRHKLFASSLSLNCCFHHVFFFRMTLTLTEQREINLIMKSMTVEVA